MSLIDRRHFIASSTGFIFAPWLPAFAEYAADVPRSAFGATSTAEEVTVGLDLTGKTALVTGCNSGIGYETMRVLALRGAHVLGTARTMEKGRDACASIDGQCTPLTLELTDFDSVVDCAHQVIALDTPLDMLICNAGILFREHRQVGELEMHFVVNHLGHFLLVKHLLDAVIAAPQGRIVVVGSKSHRNADRIRFDDLSGKSWDVAAYSHSKLANGLFSLELARRLSGTRATSNCLHPGSVATNIFRTATRRSNPNRMLKDLAEGASTSCYVATSPNLAGISGYYFVDCNPLEPSTVMRDTGMAKKLWDVSATLVDDYLP